MRTHLLLLSLKKLLAFGVAMSLGGVALAACSAYQGRVVFNEVFDPSSGGAFLEIKTLDPTVVSDTNNFSGWKIAVYKNSSATKSEVDLNSVFTDAAKNSCGQSSAWIKIPDSVIGGYINNANPGSNLNFVMYETAGTKIVDVLRLGAASSFYGAGSNYATCPTIESALPNARYDAAWGSNGNKDWYRTPDGTGSWGGRATSNTSDTNCANNDTGGTVSAPAITTTAATGATATGLTWNGTVYPYNASTAVSFEYGTVSGSYASTCAAGTKTGTTVQTFACSSAALTCGTTYYFRAKGVNSGGTAYGAELSAATLPCVTASSFSAYESNISNTSAATAANRVIHTRVATTGGNLCPSGVSATASTLPSGAKTCSLTVAAFSAGAVAATYGGTVNVKLQYCSNVSRSGAGASSTVSCGGTWADLSTAQSVTLTSGVGVATFSSISNAYEVVRVHINSSALGITSYSDDYFAIRPTGLTVTATDATVSTAGTARSLTTGSNTHKAGRPFTLNAQAYVSSSATTAGNYKGTGAGPVSQTASTTSPTGGGRVDGTLVPGAWSGSGTLTSSTATYTEVGTFTLTLQDQDFANIDVADGSSTAERYFSGTASLGRFTPDHFQNVVSPACGTFSYGGVTAPALAGQPFTVQITALNANGNPTLNYGLTTNTVTLSDATASTAGSLANNTVASSSFRVSDGVASVTAPTYTFATKATLPTSITLRATDVDGVSSSGFETAASTTIQSGRIRLQNGYGSEFLDLVLPVVIQQYSADGWITGTDTCTTLLASHFALVFPTDAKNGLAACETAISVAGGSPSPVVTLSKPGTGNSGWTDVALSLGGVAVGSKCTAVGGAGGAETPANLPWLRFDWTGSGTPGNPVGRATFGIYKSPLIYRRENY